MYTRLTLIINDLANTLECLFFIAILTKLDQSVGEIVNALDSANMLHNSIIVFSTDNGGAPMGFNLNYGSNFPLRGAKYTLWEGGVRGVGLIWSPLLKKKHRISHQLMHICDWLPTLYTAAGGNINSLPTNLDGINMWEALSLDKPSPRKETLLNIDEDSYSLILNNFKLITNKQQIDKNDWYGPQGNLNPRSYNISSIRNSQAGQSLSKMRSLPKNMIIK